MDRRLISALRKEKEVTLQEVINWDVHAVEKYLEKKQITGCGIILHQKQINGKAFLELNTSIVSQWELSNRQVYRIIALVKNLNQNTMAHASHPRRKQGVTTGPLTPPLPPKPTNSIRPSAPPRSFSPPRALKKTSLPGAYNSLPSRTGIKVKANSKQPPEAPPKYKPLIGEHETRNYPRDLGPKFLPPVPTPVHPGLLASSYVDTSEDSFSDDDFPSCVENVYEPPINERSMNPDQTNQREEDARGCSEVPTPPLLPAPRKSAQNSATSSLSSLHSSTADFGASEKERPTLSNSAEIQPWFFNISRQEAEVCLQKCADGTFLVRPSTSGGNDTIGTLNVQFSGRVFHVLIQRRENGRLGLGTTKEGEETFASVGELVEYYKTKRLQLFSNGNLFGTTSLTGCFQSHCYAD